MNKTQDKFSLPAVTLSIFAAAAAERLPVCSSSRALLWQEVLAAVLLMILSALVSRFWQSGPPKPAAWAAAFCLQVWLAVELAGTFWKALQVCREEFSSLALLGFLPLLLWVGWQMPARAWGAPAQVLWWFVAVGSAVCLMGLSRQMHWAGLFAQAAPQSTAFTVPVYAEYFAVPLLCGAGIAACMEHRDIFPAGRGAAAGLADLRDFSHRGAVHGRPDAGAGVRHTKAKGSAAMKQRWARILLYAVLVGWCLLFLRCETTEKSMIRVVYLEQKEQTWSVGLLYQSPEAAADAADASAALRIADGRGQTLETALAAAEETLPQTADYRLCDYVLFPEQTEDAVLAAYENLVLERGCGRTAARLSCTEFDLEILLQACEKTEELPDKLLDKLKAGSAAMPRLYAHEESMLLPVLCLPEAQEGKVMVSGSEAFRTGSGAVQRLTENETEAFLLLTGTPGKRTFWLQGKRVAIRRCTVSVALRKQTATLRLDCQTAYGTPQPDAAQCQQLEELCLGVVRSCWQQGTDLLHLREHSLLRTGSPDGFDPTKNACPQLQADVVFLGA